MKITIVVSDLHEQDELEKYLRGEPSKITSIETIVDSNWPAYTAGLRSKIGNDGAGSNFIKDNPLFPVRARNCLSSINITTIEQLKRLTEDDILKIRSAGRKTVHDIKVGLKSLGLGLSHSL